MNSQAWPTGAAPTFSPSRLLSYTLRTPTFCKLKRSNFFSIKAESSDEQRSVGVKESPAINDSEPSRKVSTASSGAWAAVGAVALGVAVFSATRLGGSEVNLSTLERAAVPLDRALQSQNPTLVEFYANWCEVCRELAPDVYKVEEQFKDKVSFVMLNIENPKWAPEVAEYRIDGVPHFLFLNSRGEPEAAAVGRLPKQVLEGNVRALSEGTQLPFRGASGATSSLSGRSSAVDRTSPQSHG